MSGITRRETFGLFGAAGLWPIGNFFDTETESAAEDPRDCLAAIACFHVPELQSVYAEASFHNLTLLAKNLTYDLAALGEMQSAVKSKFTDGKFPADASRIGPAVEAYVNEFSSYERRTNELIAQKSGFEAQMAVKATEFRSIQTYLVGLSRPDSGGPLRFDPDYAHNILQQLNSQAGSIRYFIDQLKPDERTESLKVRLSAVNTTVESTMEFVRSEETDSLLASLRPTTAASLPSLAQVAKILEKHFVPVLGREYPVRGLSKPAFKVRGSEQPPKEERQKMIESALFGFNFFLNGKCGAIATEIAKGG